jgi:hypothetical protein
VKNHHIVDQITIEIAIIYHNCHLFFLSLNSHEYIFSDISFYLEISYLNYPPRLSIINFIINHANEAMANQPNAIIIVSFHFVLSCSNEPNSILYDQTIINIIATVHAIVIKKSIAFLIITGISSICIFQFFNAFSVFSLFHPLKFQSTHQSANDICTYVI